MIILRSLLFNILFYLNLLLHLLAAIPALVLPRRATIELAKSWGRTSLWLLRVICRIGVDWRGLEKIPPGGLIIASKHQSTWETFALLSLFWDPAFILKRELTWIPLFGWSILRSGMIPIDRGAGRAALATMTAAARKAIAARRQIIIFPEGTRMPVGVATKYKFGIAHLYTECGVPCVPIALTSGLLWPRRRFLRFPGTVRVQILDPIPPGKRRDVFFAELVRDLDAATARLLAEEDGRNDRGSAQLDRAEPSALPRG